MRKIRQNEDYKKFQANLNKIKGTQGENCRKLLGKLPKRKKKRRKIRQRKIERKL